MPLSASLTSSFLGLLVLAGILLAPETSWAQDESPSFSSKAGMGETPESLEISSITTEWGSRILLFPPGDIYPSYIADPHRVGMAIQVQQYSSSEIPEAGKRRFSLKTGGNIGVFRIHLPEQDDLIWQFNIEAGFDALFDMENSLDNIGWDGNYGFTLTMAPGFPMAFKIGMLHTSSHIGDEYIERTGAERLNYTRMEYRAGLMWFENERWRTYIEGGWAFELRNQEVMAPWRLQAGIEFENDISLLQDIFKWYAAMDLSTWEERDWHLDFSLQAGLMIPSAARRFKLGLEFYHGRVPLGEFFQYDESYIALEASLDL